LTGGIIGVTSAPVVSFSILQAVTLPFTLSVKGIVISLCASVSIGIVSGIYPGLKASKINPVEILRIGL
jgi:putative ABC transport system permease protein